MGCNCNKISNTCGEKLYAACTYYEGAIPAFTTMAAEACYTVEEVLADIYLIETAIKDEIDLTGLLGNGITYTLVSGAVITKNALSKHAELIVALQATVDALTDGTDSLFTITNWGLDFDCIADSCANPPDLLKDLLQLIITQVCTNKSATAASVINDISTAYILGLSDVNDIITLNNAAAVSFTVPTNAVTAIPIGSIVHLVNLGAGVVTIGGAGITFIQNIGGLTMAQGDSRTLKKIDTDTWVLGY